MKSAYTECGECLIEGCRSHAAYHYGHGVAAKRILQQLRQLTATIIDKSAHHNTYSIETEPGFTESS